MTNTPRTRFFVRLAFCLPLIAAAALSSAGCSWLFGSKKTEYLIPEFPTPQEQYAFAEGQRAYTTPSSVPEKRKEQMEKIIAAFEAVEKRFPEDRQYTPLARLALGMLWQRQPDREAKLKAIEYLQLCQQLYPEDDNILARSLYEQGVALDTLGQFENAQIKYREVFSRFGQSSDPNLRALSGEARSRYNKVHTRAKSGVGF